MTLSLLPQRLPHTSHQLSSQVTSDFASIHTLLQSFFLPEEPPGHPAIPFSNQQLTLLCLSSLSVPKSLQSSFPPKVGVMGLDTHLQTGSRKPESTFYPTQLVNGQSRFQNL